MEILTELENTSSRMKIQNYEKVDEFIKAVEVLKNFYLSRPSLLLTSENISAVKMFSIN